MSKNQNQNSVQDRVAAEVGDKDLITMYQLANMASNILGIRVREQQFYNYRKNNLIKGLIDGRLTNEGAIEFLTKFCGKRVS